MEVPIQPFELMYSNKTIPPLSDAMITFVNNCIRGQWSRTCRFAKITVLDMHRNFKEFTYGQMEIICHVYKQACWNVQFVTLGTNAFEYFLLFSG